MTKYFILNFTEPGPIGLDLSGLQEAMQPTLVTFDCEAIVVAGNRYCAVVKTNLTGAQLVLFKNIEQVLDITHWFGGTQ